MSGRSTARVKLGQPRKVLIRVSSSSMPQPVQHNLATTRIVAVRQEEALSPVPVPDQWSLAVCSYNTPSVILGCLESFAMYHEGPVHLLLSENSTDEVTALALAKMGVPYFRNPGFTHQDGINACLDKCTTHYMLLVDSDVLFNRPVVDLLLRFEKSEAIAGGTFRSMASWHPRLLPWFNLFDVSAIKALGIRYYDPTRLGNTPSSALSYDVGSFFYADVSRYKLMLISWAEQGAYIRHFEGMSWRHTHPSLKVLASSIARDYANEVSRRNFSVSLEGIFF